MKSAIKNYWIKVVATAALLAVITAFMPIFQTAASAQLPLNLNAIGDMMGAAPIDERLCTEPPSRAEDFWLGPNHPVLMPFIVSTKFQYGELQVIIRLFYRVVASAIGYRIKKEDEPYIYDAGKKIIACEIDEALCGKYTWNGENQIFETIDSFFAARSENYSRKSVVDRRKLFNLISEGPIYRTGTPVSLTPAAAALGYSVTPLAASPFPAGHPYAGYNIYMCSPRGVWYFRNAVRRNIDQIKAAIIQEDASLRMEKNGKISSEMLIEKASEIKTLTEMIKLLRINGAADAKLIDDKYFETIDIANDFNYNSLTQNTGDVINTLKMSGYSVPAEKIDLYKKLWTMYSTPKRE